MLKKVLFVLMTVAFGAFAGAFTWLFFFVMNTGIAFLWDTVPRWLADIGLPAVAYPVLFCTVGGLAIGLFTKKLGSYTDSMNEVMATVKKTGRYDYDHMGARCVGALLPLLFGGSIGPEAGMTGIIAGLCTWVGDRLRLMGAEMRDLTESGTAAVITAIFSTPLFGLAVSLFGVADQSDRSQREKEVRLEVSKPLKIAVYVLAVAGALGTIALLGHLFGHGGGLPRFSTMTMGHAEILWALPLMLTGATAGWLFFPAGALARKASAALMRHPLLPPVLAGLLLGVMGTVLPFTLFSGEDQLGQLSLSWGTLGAAVLIATGFAKVIVTQFCLNLGWRGGHFFPVIFAGIAIGYGLAAVTGIDPVFSLCAVTGALLGTVMRHPVMTMMLLFLVFPVEGAPVLLIAAALGSVVPVPRRWLEGD